MQLTVKKDDLQVSNYAVSSTADIKFSTLSVQVQIKHNNTQVLTYVCCFSYKDMKLRNLEQ